MFKYNNNYYSCNFIIILTFNILTNVLHFFYKLHYSSLLMFRPTENLNVNETFVWYFFSTSIVYI